MRVAASVVMQRYTLEIVYPLAPLPPLPTLIPLPLFPLSSLLPPSPLTWKHSGEVSILVAESVAMR